MRRTVLSAEDNLDVFRAYAHQMRFAFDGYATRKQTGAVFKRIDIFARSIRGFSLEREERLSLMSGLLGRKISSFSDISFGEAIAILNESDLGEMLAHVWGNQSV